MTYHCRCSLVPRGDFHRLGALAVWPPPYRSYASFPGDGVLFPLGRRWLEGVVSLYLAPRFPWGFPMDRCSGRVAITLSFLRPLPWGWRLSLLPQVSCCSPGLSTLGPELPTPLPSLSSPSILAPARGQGSPTSWWLFFRGRVASPTPRGSPISPSVSPPACCVVDPPARCEHWPGLNHLVSAVPTLGY